ncbi:NAD(P)H-hydrate dehydratase [Sphingorhabdus sp.]|uniref:NAD(P)H-hydrate dehydratase n=1 Tax=Sphingorhabdus sp. TaxID=1902408 RepID=UPI00391DC5D3
MGFTLNSTGDRTILRPTLVPPSPDSHKYSRGHAMIWSGPPLRTGASRLSARAALAVGAGLVTLVGDRPALLEHASHVTSIMLREADREFGFVDDRVTGFAIGPGAGVGQALQHVVLGLLGRGVPTVLDADALTTFEHHTDILFDKVGLTDVMTPHLGEFQRIFPDISVDSRQDAVRQAAKTAGCIVLLKGPETWIATPDGQTLVNRHASPWLATAGSGDVLTGLICGLLAQGVPSFDAASIAAWLHGDIGTRAGPGLTADIMIGHIPLVLRGCLNDAPEYGSRSRT